MNTLFFKKGLLITLFSALGMGWCSVTVAASNILVDGSTGIPGSPLLPTSGYINIEGSLYGTQAGSNLFFSFNVFNVGSGDTANFTCTSCAPTNNVIARVTGVNVSIINGNISLSDVLANSNFWFFNPNGVVLGNGASIDVGGSLHISTANQLNFAGGSFLTANSSDLNFSGAADPSKFNVNTATTDLEMQGATLQAGGDIDLSAKNVRLSGNNTFITKAGSKGNVNIQAGDTTNMGDITVNGGASTFSVDGDVTLEATQNITVDNGQIIIDGAANNATISAGNDLSVQNQGSITATNRGNFEVATNGNLTVDNASINAANGGNFKAKAGGNLSVQNQGTIEANNNGTFEATAGGDLTVGSFSSSPDLDTSAISANNTGDATISAGKDLKVQNGGAINFTNTGKATAGAGQDLLIHSAGSISADSSVSGFETKAGRHLSVSGANSKITANNSGSFKASAVGDLSVTNQGSIEANNNGSFEAKTTNGDIIVGSDPSSPDLDTSAISANNTGDATISAGKDLKVQNGGAINFTNTGKATASANNKLLVDNASINLNNGAHTAMIDGKNQLTISNNGEINANNQGNVSVKSSSGSLDINTGGKLNFNNTGKATASAKSALTVASAGEINANNNGDFKAQAGQSLTVDGGSITAANTGDAVINAGSYEDNAGVEQQSAANEGDLTVQNSGAINLNNSGNATVSANNKLLVDNASINLNNGAHTASIDGKNQLTISNNGEINANNQGNVSVKSSSGSLDINTGGKLNFNNTGKATASAKNALTVASAGEINANNNGDFKAQAGQSLTVDGGSITAANTGDAVINAGSYEDNAGVEQQSAANEGDLTVQNSGAINLNNSGNATVSANNKLLVDNASINLNNGAHTASIDGKNQLTISNNGEINANNQGNVSVKSSSGSLDINTGGKLNFNNTGKATASAKNALTVASAGEINANNNGDFKAQAGQSLTVDGGSITAANTRDAAINAGSYEDDAGVEQQSAANEGNLTVQNSGAINLNNSGNATVSANNKLLVDNASINLNNGAHTASIDGKNQLTVSNNGEINANNQGNVSVKSSSGSMDINTGGKLNFNNTGKATASAKNALTVASAGEINANNTGDFKAQAGQSLTVDGGSITAANTGDAAINAGSYEDDAGVEQQSAANEGNLTVKNSGAINLNDNGNAKVSANNDLLVANGGVISRAPAGNSTGTFDVTANTIKVTGKDATTSSKITVAGGGKATIDGKTSLSVDNYGEISSANTHNGDITVKSSNGNVDVNSHGKLAFANAGKATVSAKTALTVASAGELNANNTGDFKAQAGQSLTVDGGSITAANTGDAAINAGSYEDDAGVEQQSAANEGNLTVQNSGAINLNNSGNAKVSANNTLLVDNASINLNNGAHTAIIDGKNQLTVSNNGEINANNQGNVSVKSSSGRLDINTGGKLNFNNTGKATASAKNALTVASAGEINANNTGDFKAQAGQSLTVDGGSITAANTGDAAINAGSYEDDAGVEQQSAANEGNLTVQNSGAINLNNSGKAKVSANNDLLVANGGVISRAPAGNSTGTFDVTANTIKVTGKDATTSSKITVAGGGKATIDGKTSLSVDNYGEISSANTHNGDITVKSSNGNVDVNSHGKLAFANAGKATVSAKTALTVASAGEINANNTGDFKAQAGQSLTVDGGSITAANTGDAAINAGSYEDDAGVEQQSAANEGNLTVQNSGAINLNNSGKAKVSANNDLLVANGGVISRAPAGNSTGTFDVTANTIKVTGKDATTSSKITVAGGGKATIDGKTSLSVDNYGEISSANTHNGDITVKSSNGNVDVNSHGKLAFANAGKATVSAKTALTVASAGEINANNTGDFKAQAGQSLTVDGGSITAANTGDAAINAGSYEDDAGVEQQSAANEGNLTVQNSGAINLNNSGKAKVSANNDLLVANGGVISRAPAGNSTGTFDVTANTIKVTGKDATTSSKITVAGGGKATIDGKTSLSVDNYGEISSANTHNGDITVKSSNGNVDVNSHGKLAFANAGKATVSAKTALTVASAGEINANNTGDFKAQAGQSLTVDGGSITAANTGDAAINAGSYEDDAGVEQQSAANEGNLTVQNSGAINLNNSGKAKVSANNDLLVANGGVISRAPAGNSTGTFDVTANTIKVTGKDATTSSKITVAGGGKATIDGKTSLSVDNYGEISSANTHNGDITVKSSNGNVDVNSHGKLAFANAGKATVSAKTALTVASAGEINANNTGDFKAQAGQSLTVDGGSITAANTGDAAINAGSYEDDAGVEQQSAANEGNLTVQNSGAINLNNSGKAKVSANNDLLVANGGVISRAPAGNSTGTFDVTANTIKVTGKDATTSSKITVAGGGKATIDGKTSLSVDNYGEISSANTHNGDITVKSSNGNVDVNSHGKLAFANAGTASVHAGNNVTVQSGGSIDRQAGAGDFNVTADNKLLVTGVGSKITVTGGSGNASIDGKTSLTVTDSGEISSTNGHKGNFTVQSSNGSVNVVRAQDTNGKIIGPSGVITANNDGMFNVLANTDITVDKGTITANNSGTFEAIAGRDLTVDNGTITITANNKGDATVSAGQKLKVINSGVISANNDGMFNVLANTDITVDKGAITANNKGDATVSAGQKLKVINSGVISANNGGKFIINALANTGKPDRNKKDTYALLVDTGGQIIKNNKGNNMTVTAQSIYLGGAKNAKYFESISGTKSSTGAMIFNSTDKKTPSYFNLQNAVIKNRGDIAINEVKEIILKQSGILSTNADINIDTYGTINHKVFNKTDGQYPNFISATKPAIDGIKNLNESFISAQDQIIIDDNVQQKVDVGALLASKNQLLTPKKDETSIPKNPCGGSQRGNSTLNDRNTSGFLAEANAQMPYSIVSTTDTKIAPTGLAKADTQSTQLATLDNKAGECF